MTESPFVRLDFDPASLEFVPDLAFPRTVAGRPEPTINHALIAYRAFAIREMKQRIARDPSKFVEEKIIRRTLDRLWMMFLPNFKQILLPMLAAEYAAGLAQVHTHDVAPEVIAALAEQHAQRIGSYFHETSADAMLQGYTTYLNRRVPARLALERALNAFGLTPRQMNGLTSLKDASPVASAVPMDIEAKVKAYIGNSIRQRFGVFARQEAHNLDMQAAQITWLYKIQIGEMSQNAEKVWITEKDERVCPICGPLHGRVVPVSEQFYTEDGHAYWVPGAHVNCRCIVRVREPLQGHVQPIRKDIDWNPVEHPRASSGRFTNKPRQYGVLSRTRNKDLDEMIENAEKLRREKPVIETAPTVTQKPSLTQQPIQQHTVQQRPVVQQRQVTQQQQVSQDKPTVHQQSAQVQQVKPEVRQAIAQQVNQTVAALKIRQKEQAVAQTKKPPHPGLAYRPTMVLTDHQGNPRPAYAIVGGYRLSGPTNTIELDTDVEFYSDLDEVSRYAQQDFNDDIEQTVEDIRRQGHTIVTAHGSNEYRIFGDAVADIPDELLDDAVFAAAMEGRHGNPVDEDFWANRRVMVSWRSTDPWQWHKEMGRSEMTLAQLGRRLGVDPRDYDRYVLELHEGWQDEVTGQHTAQIEAGTKHAFERWVTSGRYSYDEVTTPAHFPVLRLEPEVESQWLIEPD